MAQETFKCSSCDTVYFKYLVKCPRCGGSIERKCFKCGFYISLGKKYCDQCGEEQPPLQEAERQEKAVKPKCPPPPAGAGRKSVGKIRKKSRFFIYVMAFAGSLAVLSVLYIFLLRPFIESYLLPVASAQKYVRAVSENRLNEAYEILAPEIRQELPVKSFISYVSSKIPESGFEFKDFTSDDVNVNSAVVRFSVKNKGSDLWKDFFLSFVRTDRGWKRSAVFPLVDEFESEMSDKNYPQALFTAQRINNLDPAGVKSRIYLCFSGFYNNGLEDSVKWCEDSADQIDKYPGEFTADEKIKVRSDLADLLYKNGRYRAALDSYNLLKDMENVPANVLCDAYVKIASISGINNNFGEAREYLSKAGSVCKSRRSDYFISVKDMILSGKAEETAINIARDTVLNKEKNITISSWRFERRKVLSDELGFKSLIQKYMPKDIWTASFEGGALYSVELREKKINRATQQYETSLLFKVTVDAWSGKSLEIVDYPKGMNKDSFL